MMWALVAFLAVLTTGFFIGPQGVAYAQDSYECVSEESARSDLQIVKDSIIKIETALIGDGINPEDEPQVQSLYSFKIQIQECIKRFDPPTKEEMARLPGGSYTERYECWTKDEAEYYLDIVNDVLTRTEQQLIDHGADPEMDGQVQGFVFLKTELENCIEQPTASAAVTPVSDTPIITESPPTDNTGLYVIIEAVVGGAAVVGAVFMTRKKGKTRS